MPGKRKALPGAIAACADCPDDADFVVLADPEGTLFCVIDLSR